MEHVGNNAEFHVGNVALIFCYGSIKINVQITTKVSLSHSVYWSKTFNFSQTLLLNIMSRNLAFYINACLFFYKCVFLAFYEFRQRGLISYFAQYRTAYLVEKSIKLLISLFKTQF